MKGEITMTTFNRDGFLNKSTNTLNEIIDMLEKLPEIKLNDLKGEKTALVIIDMVNGFAREGALQSSRVEGIIPEIVSLSKACDALKIKKVAFADCHSNYSPEFESYPQHCICGTSEGEMVDEIKAVGGYTLISKNSTNGFLEEKFAQWLEENGDTDTFIITGDCTDICIQQFAVTLKTWFNSQNKKSRVIVPMNAVETYDLGLHDGDLMHIFALYNMILNGIEVVARVE